MGRAELTPIVLTRATGLTLDASNVGSANEIEFDSDTGFYIDLDDTAQNLDPSKIVLFVTSADSADTAGGVTFVSSTKDIYTGSGVTDLAVDLTTEADTSAFYGDTESEVQLRVSAIHLAETARAKDSDGYLKVDYDTNHAGCGTVLKAFAVQLP